MNKQIQWLSYGETNTGQIRKLNQDAYTNVPAKQIWAVADGMGGHKSGELASQAIVSALNRLEIANKMSVTVKRVYCELEKVNQSLIKMASDSSNNEIIGSTAAILIAQDKHCVSLWSGDSRIYLFRNEHLEQISHDHNNLNILIESGVTTEEAETRPYAQSLTHAIGAESSLYLDAQIQEIKDNDIFLLCSDGLNKEISDLEIEHILKTLPIEQLVPKLIELTLQRGARDNVTIVLAKAVKIESSSSSITINDKS